jgi:hypothetical protein
VAINLAQLIRTLHNIYKRWGSNPRHAHTVFPCTLVSILDVEKSRSLARVYFDRVWCIKVELILTLGFYYKHDFYNQIYYSTPFYSNVFKYKTHI